MDFETQIDIGLTGLGLLIGMSAVFGLIAQVLAGPVTRWMGVIGAIGFFVGGFYASEVLYGTATIEELQPIIDGLLLDEALLGGLLVGLVVVLVTWFGTRHRGVHGPMST